ncbi:hypothetical protein E2C01_090000 [Portunus trituberculatus]|uniref:Uncharacterized protein n=1 Tax=Portunus trituberculatus TaxID=210409 RepID=A0A5B7JR37_PORTR|nr:hypothetical protein [Portunus trituberculatus]
MCMHGKKKRGYGKTLPAVTKMTMDVEAEVGEGEYQQQQKEDEDTGVSCSLDMFREHQEVRQMVDTIGQVETEFTAEKAFEDLKKILDNYQVVSIYYSDSYMGCLLEPVCHYCLHIDNLCYRCCIKLESLQEMEVLLHQRNCGI